MINILQIMEGWRNRLVPPEELKDIIDLAMKQRLAVCRECPQHSSFHETIRRDEHCTECKCPLLSKTACLSCECPELKWKPIEVNTEENGKE